MDKSEPKGGQFSCPHICVKVKINEGLLEALEINLGECSQI